MNHSLRATFNDQACMHALQIEFGIIPIESLHSQLLLNLFGRLQTAPHKFLPSIVYACTQSTFPRPPFLTNCISALHLFSCQEHFPWICPQLLPPTRSPPLPTFGILPPSTSPLAHCRPAWNALITQRTLQHASHLAHSWTSDTASRGHQYYADIIRRSPQRLPNRPAPWLQLPLPLRT